MPSNFPSLATASGVPPAFAIASAIALISRTASALTAGCEDRALSDPRVADFNPAHAALRGERNEFGLHFSQIAATDAILLLRKHDDGAALGRLVGKRSKLCRIRQLLFGHAAHRLELSGLAVAERDRAGLVEQQ